MKETEILSEVNQVVRQMVKSYIQKHELSLNAFAKLSKINQPNLHKFMNGSNLSSTSIEKLGKFFNK